MADRLMWRFWIPFQEAFGGQGGVGVTVASPDASVESAIDEANARAAETTDLLDHDSGGAAIYFATDTPFSIANLSDVECPLDGEGMSRLDGESDVAFLVRITRFIELHDEEDDDEQ